MYADIKNFITTKYSRKELGYLKDFFPQADEKFLEEWNNIHLRLFYQLKHQIKILYPNATLHVITNEKINNDKKIIYHYFDFECSHVIKLFMYGLLSEPSVYLDSDIVLYKKFKKEHLETNNDFNFYWYIDTNLQQFSPVDLPIKFTKLYNAGIVNICNPMKKTTNDMFDIHYKYFNTGSCHVTDETSASIYVALNDLKMIEKKEVNVQRTICENDFYKQQSVHYVGCYIGQKYKCFNEYKSHSLAYKKCFF